MSFKYPRSRATDGVFRLLQLALITLTLASCSGDGGERVLAPTSFNTGRLWVMVIDNSGVCIVPATVEVVGGRLSVASGPRRSFATCGVTAASRSASYGPARR
jgi:hypothetical protein